MPEGCTTPRAFFFLFMTGIYKITSPSGRTYVGQSVNILNRFIYHKGMYSNDTPKLFLSFKKYGVENHIFEVIETCEIIELNDRERHWQDFFECTKKGLNCRLTKSKDRSGRLSEETKLKISNSQKGKIIPPHIIEKVRLKMIGKKQSPETIEKRVSQLRGRKMGVNQLNFLKSSRLEKENPFFGKHHTELSKQGMREKLRGSNNYLSKPIINLQTGVFYDTLQEAADTINWDKRKLWSHIVLYKKNNTYFTYA